MRTNFVGLGGAIVVTARQTVDGMKFFQKPRDAPCNKFREMASHDVTFVKVYNRPGLEKVVARKVAEVNGLKAAVGHGQFSLAEIKICQKSLEAREMGFKLAKWAKHVSNEDVATLRNNQIEVISRDEKKGVEKAKIIHRISGCSDKVLRLYICLCAMAAE